MYEGELGMMPPENNGLRTTPTVLLKIQRVEVLNAAPKRSDESNFEKSERLMMIKAGINSVPFFQVLDLRSNKKKYYIM